MPANRVRLRTSVNLQPALAAYSRADDGKHWPYGLMVLQNRGRPDHRDRRLPGSLVVRTMRPALRADVARLDIDSLCITRGVVDLHLRSLPGAKPRVLGRGRAVSDPATRSGLRGRSMRRMTVLALSTGSTPKRETPISGVLRNGPGRTRTYGQRIMSPLL